jgi:hypothetical protein
MTDDQFQDMFQYFLGEQLLGVQKKQPTVALSSREAEYMALANTTRENLWICQLFAKLGEQIKSPTHIFVDNRSTIEYTTNAGFHACSKHINI